MRLFRGHTSDVRGVAYAPDSSTLASCGEDGTVRLWDVSTARRVARLEPDGTSRRSPQIVYDLAISPDGRWLASAWSDRRIRLWGLPTDGNPIPIDLEGHGQSVTSLAFVDGSTLVSGAGASVNRGEVAYWMDLPGTVNAILPVGHGVWSVAASPASDLVAFGTSAESRAVRFWEPTSDRPEDGFDGAKVRSLRFSPDGRSLAHANLGGLAMVWDVESSRKRFTLRGHSNRIRALAYSPDGSLLATASQDGTVRLWDAESGVERACYDWEMGRLGCVAFAPDGMTIAAGGERDVVVWDVDL